MAFLDNSGDIILDAVLTKVGREMMASPSGLQISHYALGDDEINYTQFNKSHPSGSAYYDLEILQTPVFEAFTDINANINYGLLTFSRNDILYMPEMGQNDKGNVFASTKNGIYYLAVNEDTATQLVTDGLTSNQVVKSNTVATEYYITYETGLDTTELAKDSSDQTSFIDSLGMLDATYTISVNSLFVSSVISLRTSATAYANNLTDNSISTQPSSADYSSYAGGSSSRNLSNYTDYSVGSSESNIYKPTGTSSPASTWSVIAGPSSTLCSFSLSLPSSMRNVPGGPADVNYTDYGKTDTADKIFGSGNTTSYNYIDTMVYLMGNTTGVSISVPVRIIRKA